jgi:hypothetical protein
MDNRTPEEKARDEINAALVFVHGYAGHVDDWLTIKKELLKILPHEIRTAFSTRHPLTKKQQTNDFERLLAARWSTLTSRPVVFSNDGT